MRFEAIAREYDATIAKRREKYNDAVDRIICEQLGRMQPCAILDAGCGTGTRMLKLQRQFPSCRVVGIDASRTMIEAARRRGLELLTKGTLTDLPFPEGSFDAVTCLFFVICYVMSRHGREQAARSLFRVLKPGGYLFVDAMNLWHLGEGLQFRRTPLEVGMELLRALVDPRLEIGDKLYSTMHDGNRLLGIHHACTPRELAVLFAEAGFEITRRHIIGYNSGAYRSHNTEGQILLVCRKPD